MNQFNRTIRKVLLTSAILMIACFAVFVIFADKNEAKAEINPMLNFMGKVVNSDYSVVADNVYDFSFGLYTADTGGTAVWSEDLTAANLFAAYISGVSAGASSTTYTYSGGSNESALKAGQYLTNASSTEYELITSYDTTANTVTVAATAAWSVGEEINNRPRVEGAIIDIDLGAVSDLSSVNFDQTLYLEIVFNSETMQPRKLITSAAQAFNASKLDNVSSEAFAILAEDEAITGEWSFGNIVNIATSSADSALTITQSGAGDIVNIFSGSTEVFTITNSGFVGIGTTTASSMLTVGQTLGSQFLVDSSGSITDGSWQGDVIGVAYGGTGTSTFQQYSLVYASADNVINEILAGSEGEVLIISGGKPTWVASSTGAEHPLLSVSHSDTAPNAVTRGALIIGDSTPEWSRLALGTSGYILYSDGTDAIWQDFGAPFYTYFNATTTDALSEGLTNLYWSDTLWDSRFAATSTTGLSEGSNLYWTNTRFDERLAATTSLPTLTTLGNLSTVGTLTSGTLALDSLSYSGTLDAVYGGTGADSSGWSDGIVQVVGGAWSASTTLSVPFGGTGTTTFQANSVVFASADNVISEILPGTNGYVLSMQTGVPTWSSTAAATPHNLLSAQHTDSATADALRGALIVGNATPEWSRLALGTSGYILYSDGTDAIWKDFGAPFYTYFNATTTDALSEGLTNLYWSDTLWDSRFAATSTTGLSEGSNLYWTNTRFDERLAATTSLPTLTTLGNLSTVGTLTSGTLALDSLTYSGTLDAVYGGTGANSSIWSDGIVQVVGGAWSSSSTLSVQFGGTDKTSWTQYAIPYLTDTTTFGEIGIGTANYLLAVNAGANGYSWVEAGSVGVDTKLSQEEVEDYAGALIASSTGAHTRITVAYDDADGSIDFTVDDDLHNYSWTNVTAADMNFGTHFYDYFSATSTTALSEGDNLYWTTTRFDERLAATTSLPTLTTLANLSTVGTLSAGTLALDSLTYSGTLDAVYGGTGADSSIWSDGIVQVVGGAWSASTTLSVPFGGTGTTTFQANSVVFASADNVISEILPGTNGYVLSMQTGVPTWSSTAAATPHNLLSAQHTDSATADALRGALIVGNATPEWSRLALGTSGYILYSDGTDAIWKDFGAPFYTYFNATTTDALSEGLTNLYWSDTLWDSRFAATSTTGLSEGSNLYWTNTRFDERLAATTSLPTLTTLANLSTVGTLTSGTLALDSLTYSGTLDAVYGGTGANSSIWSDGIVQVVGGAWSASTTLSVPFGGTGTTTFQANSVLFASADNVISEILPGTNGYVLSMQTGVPTWSSTAAATPHNILSAQHTDSATADALRGALIVGNATPEWSRLALGTSGYILYSDGTDAIWKDFGAPFYTYFNATTTDALSEGLTNLYWSDTLWDSRFAATSTTGLSEGSNLYWTNTRFDERLAATTSLPTLTTLANLSTVGTLTSGTLALDSLTYSGTLDAVYGGTGANSSIWSDGIVQVVGGAWSASTTLSVPFGGTGTTTFQANSVVFASADNVISEILPGTNGYVLSMQTGVPTWSSTAAATPHNLLSAQHTDSATADALRGALIVGNATPEWSRLALGTSGYILYSDGTDAIWKDFGAPFYTYFNATTTDALSEGLTNLYWSDTLWDSRFAATSTTGLSEGSNLYWTNTRFDERLAATTSLPTLTTLANLSTVGTLTSGTLALDSLTYSGTLDAVYGGTGADSSIWSDGIVQVVGGAWSASTTLSVPFGGTGTTTFQANSVLFASADNVISEILPGTNGYVLSMQTGVPTWSSTAAATPHNLLSAQHTDSTTENALRGALIVGNATPEWSRLALGTSGYILYSDGTDAIWKDFGAPFYTYFNATTTDALSEGLTNLYWSDTLWDSRFAATSTTGLSEGSNLYWTNTRFDERLAATTSLPTLTTLGNLSTVGTLTSGTLALDSLSYSGTLDAVYGGTGADSSIWSDGIVQVVGGAWSASTTLSVPFGGTGTTTFQANSVLFASADNVISEILPGTNGYVLSMQTGVPTWSSTAAATPHNLLSAQHTDSTTENALRGALIVGNATPEWSRLALGTSGYILYSDGTDAIWKDFGAPFYTYFNATTTDALSEGLTNLYWSDTLWDSRFAATSTTGLSEGSNLYWTNTRFDERLAATTSLPTLTTLANLSTVGTLTSGTLALDSLSYSGTLDVAYGGTGTTTFQTNSLIYASADNVISEVLAGADNYILKSVSGLPTWVATSSLGIDFGDIGGIVPIAQGGTGLSSIPNYGQLLMGNSSNVYELTATSSLGLLSTYSIDTYNELNNITSDVTLTHNGLIDTLAELNAILSTETIASTTHTWADAYVDNDITLDNITQITSRAISDTTGTLQISRGGTGLTSFTAGDLIYASADNTLAALASSTGGYVLSIDFTTGQPTWTATSTWDTTYTAGSGIALAGSEFSVAAGSGLTQDASGLSVTADGIGDTQLTFNTGQHLTTADSPEFAGLSIGTSTPYSKLTIWGSSGNLLELVEGTGSTTVFVINTDGDLTMTGTTTMGALTYPNYDGVTNQVLYTDGSGNIGWSSTAAATPHNILSSQHTDTTAGTIEIGDLMIVGAGPSWERLGIGTGGYILASYNGAPTWVATSTIGVQGIGAGTADYAAYWTDANTIAAEQYLATSRGGTGLGTYVIGDILYAGAANSLARLATSTAGSVLQLDLTTGLPSYVATSTLGIGSDDIVEGSTNLFLTGNELVDSDFGSDGLMVRTSANNYANRTLATSSDKIVILNADGVNGNPTFGIRAGSIDISGDTNLQAGTNITLSGDTLNVDDPFSITNFTASYASTTQLTANIIYDNDGDIGAAGQILSSTGSLTNWIDNNVGTVTSIAMSVPAGLTIGGSPITTSGTLALTWTGGYAAVLTASTTNWNAFYDVPSTVITAGDYIDWSGNTLNVLDSWVDTTEIDTLAEINAILSTETIASTTHTWADAYVDNDITLDNITQITSRAISDTTGTLQISRGGTGLTSFTAGDLIYASADNTLAALASSTGGYVLSIDFTTGQPTWTATSTWDTTYTAGDHLTLTGTDFDVDDDFLLNTGDTATGDYTFDTDTLVIDSSNNRIGIGTSTPYSKLTIWGDSSNLFEISNSASTTLFVVNSDGDLTMTGTTTMGALTYPNYDGTANQMLYTDGNGSLAWTSTSSLGLVGDDDFTSNGLMVRTAAGTYTTRTLTGTANQITIANGDGVSAAPTFSLPSLVYLGTAGKLGRDADNLIDFSTDNQLTFRTNATDQMVLNSSGYLGIGSSTPYYKLSIQGSGNLLRIATSTGAIFTVTDSQITSNVPHSFTGSGDVDIANDLYFSNPSSANITSYGPLYITSGDPGTNTSLYLEGRGTGVVYVDDYLTVTGTSSLAGLLYANYYTGNVGIGTSSPLARLSIQGASGSDALFALASSTGANLLTIDSLGNVGIGTTTPTQKLSTNGLMYIGGTGTSTIENNLEILGAFDAGGLYINSSGVVTAGTWQGTAIGTAYGGTGQDFSGSTGFMYLSSGTASASSTIHIGNTDLIAGTGLTLTSATLTMDEFTMGATDTDATAGSVFFAGTSGVLQQDNDNFFWDNTNKKLGIGTTSPLTKLTVQGTAGQPVMNIASSTGASLLYVSESGNVGIGTASPSSKFSVSGDGYITGGLGVGVVNTTAGTAIINGAYVGALQVPYGSIVTPSGGSASNPSYAFYSDTNTGINNPAAENLSFITNAVERVRIDASGNVGIGTTSPYSKLTIWGDGTSGASAFEVVDSASSTLFTVLDNGNVGIGSTSPATYLSVAGSGYFTGGLGVGMLNTSAGTLNVSGQCVTGDTRLRRRRKKKAGEHADEEAGEWEDDEYIYDEVMIKNIQPGDEIASMDPITGELVYSQVNGLMDMGIKQIYQLTTQSGRQIRTTENHPYFVRSKYEEADAKQNQKLYRFEVDQSIRIEQYTKDTIIAIANAENEFSVVIPRKVKQILRDDLRQYNPKKFTPIMFASGIVSAIEQSKLTVHELAIDIEYPGHEDLITEIILNTFPQIEINFIQIGKKSPAHYYAYGTHKKEKTADYAADINDIAYKTENALRTVTHSHIRRTIRSPQAFLINSIDDKKKLVNPAPFEQSIFDSGYSTSDNIEQLLKRCGVKGQTENALRTGAHPHIRRTIHSPQASLVNSINDSAKLVNPVPNFTENHTADKLSHANEAVNAGKQDCKIWNGVKSGKWKKVKELKKGQMIAVAYGDKVVWEKITKIKQQDAERVYDIEVEGTRNFVANGIIAHNTYLGGNTGIGTSSPLARLSIQGASGSDALFALASSTGANLLTIDSLGNVGIGTTTPTQKLSTDGLMYIGGTGTSTIENNLEILGGLDAGGLYINSSGVVTAGTWQGTAIGAAYGGTGLTSFTAGDLIYASADNTLASLASSTSGYVLSIDFSTGQPSWIATSSWDTTYTAGDHLTLTGTDFDVDDDFLLNTGDDATGDYTFDTDTLVIDSSNNRIGIGTSTPYSKLTIWGDGTSGQPAFSVVDSASSTLFTVLDNGYVGIGTAAPVETLHTVGTGYFEGSNGYDIRIADSSSGGFIDFGIWNSTNGIVAGRILGNDDGDGQSGKLSFFTHADASGVENLLERMRIDNSGDVGIGDTDPDALLEISASAGASDLFMLSSDDANDGDLFIVKNSGNIGIGTTTPYSKLTVWGDSSNLFEISNSASTTLFVVNSDGDLTMTGTTTMGALTYPNYDGTANQMLYTDGSGSLAWTGTSTLGLVGDDDFTSNGLMVRTAAGTYTTRTLTGTANQITITNGDGVSAAPTFSLPSIVYLGTAGKLGRDANDLFDFTTAGQITFRTNNSNNMILNSSGYLGIGTTTPENALTVLSADGAQMRLSYDADNYVEFTVDSAGQLAIGSATTTIGSGSEVLRITGGNVGIGTSTPYSKLTIWGDGTSGQPAFSVVDSASSTLFTVLDNGYVGIGTANPSYNLEVVGTVSFGSASGGDILFDTTTITTPVLIGIGTSTPDADLTIVSDQVNSNTNLFTIATSTSGSDVVDRKFAVDSDGDIFYDGSAYSPAADYAEYFYTVDTDLESGEAVCVDITKENAVKRCDRAADGNLMGIVSTKPAIVGNAIPSLTPGPSPATAVSGEGSSYVIVGLLGQVQAKVSTENGEIRPGDSLTSASSTPGYVMKAGAGDPTVGIALSSLTPGPSPTTAVAGEGGSFATGVINVLISRRNKSLTVEIVEQKITDRIAAMEIEDEVNILIANAVNNLNLDDEISGLLDPKLLMLTAKLTVTADDLTGRISSINDELLVISYKLLDLDNEFGIMNYELGIMNNKLLDHESRIMNYESGISVDEDGNVKMGNITSPQPSPYEGEGAEPGEAGEVAVVEIITATTTSQTAFVINQQGDGDVADFRADGVSIVNIADTGKVTIIGEMLVDGRIMVCSGSGCGSALDERVDGTMGDMGVEGTVVAGAFEGYCDDGFVWVPGSAKYGTLPGFCVMISLTPDPSPATAVAGEGSLPEEVWVNVSQGEAMMACQGLGDNYHLISENEWLTIAENIIRVADNDIDEETEGLQLATSTLTPGPSPATAVAGEGSATSSVSYVLTNGNVIYDLVGAVSEWTDQTVTRAGLIQPISDEWQEYYEIENYNGFNIAPPYYYTSVNGIGKIKTGDNGLGLRGFVRGYNGIYSLDLSHSIDAMDDVGFRCAR